jgi:ribosomal protein S18 acetylase RimI-like enzyme
MTSSTRIRSLSRDDEERAFAVISMAFISDPVSRWFFPDPVTFFRYFQPFAVALGGAALDRGTAWATDDGSGVVLWMPPGVHPDEKTMASIVEAGLRDIPYVEDISGLVEEQLKVHPTFDHMYLPFIAVDPAKQGSGTGSALLSHSAKVCDELGLPAYLEATTPRSRALYERHGFEVTGEVQFGSSPPMWAMLREPR